MPQMAPMWWTMIMMLTLTMFLLSIVINYFIYTKIIKLNYKFYNKYLNWKW